MLRKLSISLLLGLFFAPQALAQGTAPGVLMPGVTYTKRVQFTPHGPVVLNVMTAPKPGGLYSLQPVLSNESIVGREKVTDMQRRLSATATVAGVNGDLFNWNDGHPSGVLIRNGVLEHPPAADRTSVGIASDGTLHPDRVSLLGYWRGTGSRLRLGLNDPPSENGYALFTRAYGATTPAESGAAEVVLHPFPNVTANTDLVGTVADVVSPSSGKTPIPADGAVLQARGSGAFRLAGDAALGSTLSIRYTLNPTWDGIVGAVGGGPLIVRDGRLVSRANEAFSTAQLSPHDPRTAVGQREDGKIIMVAVDGRQPGYSAGVTNLELAQAMMQLGAVTASALDAGGSTTMAFDGKLLNSPSDRGGERSVAEALLISYTGVYVPPLPESVVSPNGDRVADVQSLSYKVVRPSNVQASLVGPDGVPVQVDAGQRTPGTYRFSWAGPGPGREMEVLRHRNRRPRTDLGGRANVFAEQHARGSARTAEGVEAPQEGDAPRRVVQARAPGEGHGDGRDHGGHRRPRRLAYVCRLGNAAAPVERQNELRRARVRRVVQAPRLGGQQARARRPVRAVHSTPVGSRRCSSRALRAR